jgi:hypothetical protein
MTPYGFAVDLGKATYPVGCFVCARCRSEIIPLQAESRLTACLRLRSQMVLGTG